MIGKSENIRITKNNIFFLSLVVLLVILIELTIIRVAGEYALFILSGINIAILVAIVLSGSEFHLPMLLIVINLLPLINLIQLFLFWLNGLLFRNFLFLFFYFLLFFNFAGFVSPSNFDLKY